MFIQLKCVLHLPKYRTSNFNTTYNKSRWELFVVPHLQFRIIYSNLDTVIFSNWYFLEIFIQHIISFYFNYLQPLKHGRTIPLPVLEEFFFSHTTSISFSLNSTERILTGSGLFLDCTAEVMHSVDKFPKEIDFFLIINT